MIRGMAYGGGAGTADAEAVEAVGRRLADPGIEDAQTTLSSKNSSSTCIQVEAATMHTGSSSSNRNPVVKDTRLSIIIISSYLDQLVFIICVADGIHQ